MKCSSNGRPGSSASPRLPVPCCARSGNETMQLLAARVPGKESYGVSTLNAQRCHLEGPCLPPCLKPNNLLYSEKMLLYFLRKKVFADQTALSVFC